MQPFTCRQDGGLPSICQFDVQVGCGKKRPFDSFSARRKGMPSRRGIPLHTACLNHIRYHSISNNICLCACAPCNAHKQLVWQTDDTLSACVLFMGVALHIIAGNLCGFGVLIPRRTARQNVSLPVNQQDKGVIKTRRERRRFARAKHHASGGQRVAVHGKG